MGTWADFAENLRAGASGAVLTSPLKRSIIAPGPDFGRDCRMVAVVLTRPTTLPLQAGFPGGFCAAVPQLTYDVVFVADCAPMPGDDGSPPLPSAINAWSTAFLSDVQAIYEALGATIDAGLLGDCSGVTIGDGVPTGPSGGVATMRFPVTILAT